MNRVTAIVGAIVVVVCAGAYVYGTNDAKEHAGREKQCRDALDALHFVEEHAEHAVYSVGDGMDRHRTGDRAEPWQVPSERNCQSYAEATSYAHGVARGLVTAGIDHNAVPLGRLLDASRVSLSECKADNARALLLEFRRKLREVRAAFESRCGSRGGAVGRR